jgi:hypothetical protein
VQSITQRREARDANFDRRLVRVLEVGGFDESGDDESDDESGWRVEKSVDEKWLKV